MDSRAGFARRSAIVAAALFALLLLASPSGARPAVLASTDVASLAADPDTSHYVAQVRGNYTPESRAYWSLQTGLRFLGPVYDVVVALFLLFSGVSARMRDLAHARSSRRYVRVLIYLSLFTVVSFILSFPFLWYRGFFLEHQFKLSNQGFGAWLAEQGTDMLVTIVLAGVTGLVTLAYLTIERSPRHWWLWIAAGTLPVIVVSTLIQPLVIDPLYNKYVPLQNQELKAKILSLAEKAEIPGRNVYQVDKSKQTKKYNAYVNGFGASQRIVLWDTTLKGMKDDEILFVMGHEMGHYKLAHIWKGIVNYSLLSVGLLFFSWATMNWAVRRFGRRWGFTELHDVASMPLLLAALTVATFIAEPASNSYSRRVEHEADVFALEVTRLNDAGARAYIKLGSQNRSNPEPPALVKVFQYTHPPLIERIRFALSYRPWEEEKPNQLYRPRHASRIGVGLAASE